MQWLSSEREKRSVVPPAFWYFSIGGAVILLAYAVYERDIVFIVGQSSGLFIYLRNLQLIRNNKKPGGNDSKPMESATITIRVAEADQHRKAA